MLDDICDDAGFFTPEQADDQGALVVLVMVLNRNLDRRHGRGVTRLPHRRQGDEARLSLGNVEHAGEVLVHELQDRRLRPEIRRDLQNRCRVLSSQSVFGGEIRRNVSAAEPINRLLRVPYQEQRAGADPAFLPAPGAAFGSLSKRGLPAVP